MATIKRVLCVCIGNGDRSPVMAAVLGLYLRQNPGHEVICESAGIGEHVAEGSGAAEFAVIAAKRIGLDISGHSRRRVASLNLVEYDLIICVSDEIAGQMVGMGVDLNKIYNAQVPNPWPVHFEQDYEGTMTTILGAMYKVVARYFSK